MIISVCIMMALVSCSFPDSDTSETENESAEEVTDVVSSKDNGSENIRA